jgi:hypothetical protein
LETGFFCAQYPPFEVNVFHLHQEESVNVTSQIIIITKTQKNVGVNSAGNVLSRTYVMEVPGVSCTKTHRVTWQT